MIPQSEIANAFYSGVQAVSRYMRERAKPMLAGVASPSLPQQSINALFLRSVGWMSTLEKLNHPQHFQAIATGTRALLEGTVDVVLLCHDNPKHECSQRMLAWTRSAKFKQCECVKKFYANQGQPVPDEHEPMVAFYDREKSLMPGLRSLHWSGKHPERWTANFLPDDCREADKVEGPLIRSEVGMTLVEFYETQIRRLNWSIHMSGVAAVQDISYASLCGLCALAFKWSADLATLTTKLAFQNAGFTAASQEIATDWQNLRNIRLAAVKAGIIKTHSSQS
jgi:hypothetical protein